MIRYRQATRDELDLAIDWAAGEGWNPGLHDGDAFWAADPDGFVCAEEDGQVLATGSTVSYDGRFGFMGFFIVRPDRRGEGIGREFWRWRRDRLRSRLADGAGIGLDGVFAMQDFYARGGFVMAHRSFRMAGRARAGASSERVVDASDVPFQAILACDRHHFGVDRERFLRSWLAAPGSHTVATLDGATVTGYGVARACRAGFKVGPLFADDPQAADALFGALSDRIAGSPVALDVPEVNPAAIALAEAHGLTPEFGCARMYLGAAPSVPWAEIYGITSFELG